MDYTWLAEIMVNWGEQYPAYFETTLGADLRTCALIFWFVVLLAVWEVFDSYEHI